MAARRVTLRTDEQLALAVQAGDLTACAELVDRFTGLAYTLARPYITLRSDSDDMRQEALIAIVSAAHSYRPDGGASFKSLAVLAIRRRLYTVIVTDNRMMRRAAVAPFELDRAFDDEDGEGGTGHDVTADRSVRDFADLLADRDQLQTITRVIRDELSPLERDVFAQWVNGQTYVETAQELGLAFKARPDRKQTRSKAVDNALQRARRKLRAAVDVLEEPLPLGVAA